MTTSWGKLENFFAQDLWELFTKPINATETGTEISKTGLELSVALGLLGSPPAPTGVAIPGFSFVGLATKGVRFYLEKTNEQPTLAEYVVLVSRLAYLESLEAIVNTIKDEDSFNKISNLQVTGELQQRTNNLQITDDEARKAITCFRETKLAHEFNRHLSFCLKIAGIDPQLAEIITQRVSWNTQRYMNQALAEVRNTVKSLSWILRDGYRQELKKYQSIDDYLNHDIAKKPQETVFVEDFTFADIYVPLKAQPLDKNGDEDKNQQPVDLEAWVQELLYDPKKQDKVIFIQGEPGSGKSLSCKMFADYVRQNLYPIWIPILIRLRDIKVIEKQFENTLKAAVDRDFAINDDGWLTDQNIRYLFLLDGFDELLMEGRTSCGLKEFIKQVGSFQENCQRNPEKGHRVLITGRTLALQTIEKNMPGNLERVKILPMDGEIQQQWFRQWEAQVGKEKTTAFQQFLDDNNCPKRVQELAQEPLLIYLLAAMHRNGKLTTEMFAGSNRTQAKILIYQKSLEWLLTKQRPELLQQETTKLQSEDLRRILTATGLCVMQSGGECAPMSMIEERLKGNETAKEFLEAVRERLGESPLKNSLATFYFQPGKQTGAVEFTHKSFGEFLFAERLTESLSSWTEPGIKGKGFNIQQEQMDWEIYDLLGYGGLTPEVVEYLMGLVVVSDEFRPIELFQRLEDFYQRWCAGKFIDAYTETLPQKKSRQLHEQKIELGQRQVDIYAGLNVMILLLELNRYGRRRYDLKEQIIFYPSGELKRCGYTNQLLRVINYSDFIGIGTFNQLVKQYFSGANLFCADLRGADLRGVNFSYANLFCANLRGANFRGANFRGTNLSHANLSHTNLSHANLSHGNLREVQLDYADLSNANLSDADLSPSSFKNADLSNADLSHINLRDSDLGDTDLRGAELTGADLRDTINLTPQQVKSAKNWEKAQYNENFHTQLGLSLHT